MVILLFKTKQKLIIHIFLPVCRLWFQKMPYKKYTEICGKELSLEREDDRMNMKREKGCTDFLYSCLKEGINRSQRNTKESQQLLRKSCKRYVG